jgi:hypothetical protein
MLKCTLFIVQVQTPQCGTGSCQRGPQICCRTVWKQVCNQVIVKVARTVQVQDKKVNLCANFGRMMQMM